MVVLCSSLFLVFFLFGFLRMSVIYGRNSCCEVGILRFVGVLDFVCFIGCVSVECCRDVLMLWFCVQRLLLWFCGVWWKLISIVEIDLDVFDDEDFWVGLNEVMFIFFYEL